MLKKRGKKRKYTYVFLFTNILFRGENQHLNAVFFPLSGILSERPNLIDKEQIQVIQ